MSNDVRLRPITDSDEPLLFEAFLAGRPELAELPPELARLQLRMQRQQYREHYPAAVECVIGADDELAGRCIVSRSTSEIRLMDITVLRTHRERGIGSAVLAGLVSEAMASGRAFRLSAWRTNEGAIRLYRRLGMRPIDDVNGYVHMELPAPVPTPEETTA